MLKETEVSFLS